MRVAFVLGCLLLIGPTLGANSPATTQATTQAADQTVVVKTGTIQPSIDAEGYFEPIDSVEVRIHPKAYEGDLKIAAAATHGASVKAGDVLLQIETDQIDRQIAAAESDLANTHAAADKAQADLDLGAQADALALKMQQTEVKNTEAGVKWWDDVDGKQLITTAELNTKTAKAAVEDQQDELEQLKKMYKTEELTNATADIVVKRALRNLEINKVTASMAEERESKTKKFDYDNGRQKLLYAVDQQNNTLKQLQATQAQSIVTRKTALDSSQAALAKAQRKLDDLKSDLANFTVKAPADGVVFCVSLVKGSWQDDDPKLIRPGEKITADKIVLTFFRPGNLKLIANIPENRINWLTPGTTTARITPISLPEAATDATCGQFVPTAASHDNGQAFATPFVLSKVDARLLPGEKSDVHIELPQITDAIIVPTAAISHGQVRVKKPDGSEERRAVIVGFSDGEHVQIKSGLSEGEAVFTSSK